MGIRVYSCAKAHFFRKSEPPKQTWDWITGMFRDDELGRQGSKSFIAGGHHLQRVKGTLPPRAGDVFKYGGFGGSENYIEITHWDPFHSLIYTEACKPTGGQYVHSYDPKDPPTIMKFRLEDHPEGTNVFIERVESGNFSFLGWLTRRVLGGFNENTCVGRLCFILRGKEFPKGRKYVDDTYTIERDDSLRRLKADGSK